MSVNTTYGSLVIESALPKDIQDLSRKYDKKMVTRVLKEVAQRSPELYESFSDVLLRVGDEFATRHGRSFNYADEFDPSPDRDKVVARVEREIKAIIDSKLPPSAKVDRMSEIFNKGGKELEVMVLASGKKRDSLMYNQYTSGAKGNAMQLRMINEAPLGVVDHRNRPIPVVIRNSYAEGVSPNEMFALSYGARKGLMATKMATADTGAFEKALTVLNIATVVTEADCHTQNGVMYDVSDLHNTDKYLATAAGPYPRNTLITAGALSLLKKKGIAKIRVRSPLTCEATDGGLCSKCFGLDENGRLPGVGVNVGVNAAQGMAEPLTQMSMDTKHSGGAVGSRSLAKGGFKAVKQLLTVPKNFPGAAVVSPTDGTVLSVSTAPQGGTYIQVGGAKLYAAPGASIYVKKGQAVQAGQALSEGLVNPVDMASAVGLGQARNTLVSSLRELYVGAGLDTPRRHLEITAMNMLSLAESEHKSSGHLPGDVFKVSSLTENQALQKSEIPVELAVGKYLARNYIHHTIGTKIGSRVVSDLKDAGITKVMCSDIQPAFTNKIVSIERVPLHQDDFLARMGSSRITDSMLRAAHLGESSKVHNNKNPIPAYAWGADFGKNSPYY